MANALFDSGRNGFLTGLIDWDTDVIKAVLVNHAVHVPSLSADVFLSDLGASIVATSSALTTPVGAAGVADCDDVTFLAVTGAICSSVVLFKDTGVAATSRLIAYMDTATNLPVTPNGGSITVQWDNTTNKVFKL
jgi:hypothetical protein